MFVLYIWLKYKTINEVVEKYRFSDNLNLADVRPVFKKELEI